MRQYLIMMQIKKSQILQNNRQIQDFIQKSITYQPILSNLHHSQDSNQKNQQNYLLKTIKMQNQNNLSLLMQGDDDYFMAQDEQIQQLYNRQKSKYDDNSQSNSYVGRSDSKFGPNLNNKNQNKQLQDLLQTDTVIYGNISNLSTQKKRLFTDLSFFSKDYTHDLSNEEGYHEMVNKIHFQRSRNRQLNNQLAQQKQRIIQKHLKDIMQEFKELSDQNKRLRKIYKKQAGGGYKNTFQRNNSVKQQDLQKNKQTSSQCQPGSQTPRNSMKNGRKSIATISVTGSEQPNYNNYNSHKPNMTKENVFFGIGNQNFCQTTKMQTLRPSNKLHICQSSINIISGPSLAPSPKKHKRRQSQLTQRKDYPAKQNYGNGFLLMMDDGQMSFDNEMTGRMSQPGKMPKQRCPQQIDENDCAINRVFGGNNNQTKLNESIERNSLKVSLNEPQMIPQATNTKNIFIQFLQTLLLEEKISYTAMTEEMNQNTMEQQHNFIVPSYNNIKYIEQLEKQITTKNLKLRQLQEVINVFKSQIEQIMGTDIKMINELMIELLQVKGKYLQMQEKVNGITGLKRDLQVKQKMKENIINQIKQKIQAKKKQAHQKQQSIEQLQQNFEVFPIPQSIKTLFDLLNIEMPKNSKPIQYLNHIKELPKNKDLFQAFDSKKRATCNLKIKEIIDQIRQGRKKFNEVIKIYEGRIVKLQQKLQRCKNEKP